MTKELQLISDKDLVELYLQGKESALAELIERHKDRVYTTIYMFVKDEILAEDLFQDTFIKVIETLRKGTYYEDGKFLGWVLRIAHNLCVDYYRKTKRKPAILSSQGDDIFKVLRFEDDNAETQLQKQQSSQKIRLLIDQLPEEQKEVVILRHYGDLSFKEIADITNVSINTALGRMRYALINLRKAMSEKQIVV